MSECDFERFFMSITQIKSKPTYGHISLNPLARKHVFIGSGTGSEAIMRCLKEGHASHVIILLETTDKLLIDRFKQNAPSHSLHFCHETNDLLYHLKNILEACYMGTQIYIAGPEIFIWTVTQMTKQYGLSKEEIQQELCGSSARKVFCVHCKIIIQAVTSNVIQCHCCTHFLMVRDHFSRHLGAYIGVRVDAEVPGDIPMVEEAFL